MADAKYDCDLAVIGSGPGGYVAAIRASQLGLRAVVIEKDQPGGVCLNIGCIPSKALIYQAELFRKAEELEAIGLGVDRSGLDYSKVFAASRRAADRLSKGVQFLLKKNNVEYVQGEARLADSHAVKVRSGDGERTITGRFILVATGSRPRELKGFEFDEKTVLSSTGLLMMQDLPKSLLILGSGYIGMEFAHAISAFGVEVHVVEMLDQVLPLEDADLAGVVEKSLRKRGVKFTVSSKAVALKRTDAGAEITLEGKDGKQSAVQAQRVLVAVGRAPNTEGLGLETLGVKLNKGFVTTGDYYQTACAGIYAIGDITGEMALAHVASKHGEIAAEHMAGRQPREKKVDATRIPAVIFTDPQLAGFGLNERQARQAGRTYKTATFPFRGIGKAVAVGHAEGFLKLLYDPQTHEVLGAGMVGPEAAELIHESMLVRQAELLPTDLAEMIHAHPTLSEGVMEVFRAAEGRAIHA